MNVSVYGAGYVGLVTAVCLAELGHHVICVDIDDQKIANLQQGQLPIYEEGLANLLQKNLKAQRITFTTDSKTAIAHGIIQMIAVGTPPRADGSADMQYVEAVAKTIATHMTEYRLIVTKSTVPVGTGDRVRAIIAHIVADRQVRLKFNVASNPEFLREGCAVADFMQPDRVIVGTARDKALQLLKELYAPLNLDADCLVATDIRSAELSKYAANAFLATKISFMNEMSQLAEHYGADIELVRQGMGLDPRIGKQYLNPGCGFGGSCFPKDVAALKYMADQVNFKSHILDAVMLTNENQKAVLFQKINHYFADQLRGKVIALWGLAFKPNTDDVRAAPSRELMQLLWQAGATVQAYDPMGMHNIQAIYGDRAELKLCASAEQALQGADVLAIVTEWPEFRSFNLGLIKNALRHPAIFDGRNIFDPSKLRDSGIDYFAIGRGAAGSSLGMDFELQATDLIA